MKPSHRGLGNSHGKENKALLWSPPTARDEKPFAALRKIALKGCFTEWRKARAANHAASNAKRRAENETEIQRAQAKLDRRNGVAA